MQQRPETSPSPRTRVSRLEPQNRIAGKYRLRRRIAVGGMGEVWVAKNEATGADVALKVLRRDADATLQAEARFRHEARLGAMLSHRNIVKIYDLVEEPAREGVPAMLVLVMELLRGETLHAYLERKGPRPAKEAVAMLVPILGALHHAHELGIVHRDVTPANIYLAVDPDGQVTPKLVDFGIAKVKGSDQQEAPSGPRPSSIDWSALKGSGVQTIDGRILGTPRYMPPEQIRGAADLDGRADIFSVGVVLYEALTGVSPFSASTPGASLQAVLDAHIDPDPRIDPRLWVEIQRALSKRPYERHATANELAIALRFGVNETEGSLATALQRTHPPPRTTEDNEHAAPPVVSASAMPPALETKSFEGQSVVLAVPRSRLSWVAWAGGGLVIGVIAAFAIGAMRTPQPPSVRPVSANPSAAATTTSVAPTPHPADAPPAADTSTATSTATPQPPPTTTTTSRPRYVPRGTTAPRATATAATPPAPPHPPKPLATTPGF